MAGVSKVHGGNGKAPDMGDDGQDMQGGGGNINHLTEALGVDSSEHTEDYAAELEDERTRFQDVMTAIGLDGFVDGNDDDDELKGFADDTGNALIKDGGIEGSFTNLIKAVEGQGGKIDETQAKTLAELIIDMSNNHDGNINHEQVHDDDSLMSFSHLYNMAKPDGKGANDTRGKNKDGTIMWAAAGDGSGGSEQFVGAAFKDMGGGGSTEEKPKDGASGDEGGGGSSGEEDNSGGEGGHSH